MNEETIEQFAQKMKQFKQKQESYFELITSGHYAICLCELNIEKDTLNILDTATCSDCHRKGWDNIFQMGLMCGMELKEWKKKHEG